MPQGKLLEPHKYAALQKLDDPSEICAYEAIPSPRVLRAEHVREVAGSPGVTGALQLRWGQSVGSDRVPRADTPSLPSHETPVWDGALTS